MYININKSNNFTYSSFLNDFLVPSTKGFLKRKEL